MSKSLGQIAYEAFWKLRPLVNLLTWEECPVQQAWQAAAEAVVKAARDADPPCYVIPAGAAKHLRPGAPMIIEEWPITGVERAVIEAARKWREDLTFDGMTGENAYVLYSAVMALEAAEKADP